MAGNVSKNAHREGAKVLTSRWGGAIKMKSVFEKSSVTVWECRVCGHIVVGTKAPEVCPVCKYSQAYFEVHKG